MKVTEAGTKDFSLVQGGPLYAFFRRLRLADENLGLWNRRVIAAIALTWLPLLVLEMVDGFFLGRYIEVTFLKDITVHTRFLVALPILIAAEAYVHKRISFATRAFRDRKIVTDDDVPRFERAVATAHRLRDSWVLEIVLFLFVFVVGHWFWQSQMAREAATWYANPDATGLHLTSPGYWFVYVSIPIFQFFTLRWYARFFIWFWFLRQVSKLDLHLKPAHPDRSGGLGFLGNSTYAFAPVLFAQGAVLSGFIASEVIYGGRDLLSFKVDAVAFIVIFVAAVLSPLCVFVPDLVRTKRKGLAEFGRLASQYVSGFERKWIKGENPEAEPLLGTADIQSLADLGNSFSVVREMNAAPFLYTDVLRLAAFAAAPLAPLAFLALSVDEIVTRIFDILL